MYKRQIIFRNATEYSNRPYLRITYKGQSIELHIYEGGDESRMGYQPVSYTHLDVYKRQEYYR